MNLPSPRPGKRPGQKYKSLLVLQYLLKNADDENAVTMSNILSPLQIRHYIRPVPAGIATWLYPEGSRNGTQAVPYGFADRSVFSTNASEKPLFFRKPRLKGKTFQRYCRERPVCRSEDVSNITTENLNAVPHDTVQKLPPWGSWLALGRD